MIRDNNVPIEADQRFLPRPAFTIICGMPAIRQLILASLAAQGFRYDPAASITLLFDAPYGSALRQLETLDQTNRHMIVITSNHAPEYWDDLRAFDPAILLVNDCRDHQLENALARAANGERYQFVPPLKSKLTPAERKVLYYVVRDWSTNAIAAHLNLQPQTVANTLSRVYAKLDVAGRVGAAFYYWGRPDLLRESRK